MPPRQSESSRRRGRFTASRAPASGRFHERDLAALVRAGVTKRRAAGRASGRGIKRPGVGPSRAHRRMRGSRSGGHIADLHR